MHDDAGGAKPGNGGSSEPASEAAPGLGTVPLDASHRVENFTCSKSERVQRFLRGDCAELIGHNYCRVFVWPNPGDPTDVWGYYSLSSSLVVRKELSGSLQKKVPGGIPAPVVLIGFMGKADGVQKGFGGVLIHDAALRVSRIVDIGVWGLALDAENEQLAKWYATQGFQAAREQPRLMYGRLDKFLVKRA